VAASTPCVSAVGGARLGSGVGGGLRRVVGVSWRDGRCRGGLVQRGTWEGSGVFFLHAFHVSWPWFGQGRQGIDKGESRALLGGQGLGLGLPTTVANSCFDFV
jgi:hypothetical protein